MLPSLSISHGPWTMDLSEISRNNTLFLKEILWLKRHVVNTIGGDRCFWYHQILPGESRPCFDGKSSNSWPRNVQHKSFGSQNPVELAPNSWPFRTTLPVKVCKNICTLQSTKACYWIGEMVKVLLSSFRRQNAHQTFGTLVETAVPCRFRPCFTTDLHVEVSCIFQTLEACTLFLNYFFPLGKLRSHSALLRMVWLFTKDAQIRSSDDVKRRYAAVVGTLEPTFFSDVRGSVATLFSKWSPKFSLRNFNLS